MDIDEIKNKIKKNIALTNKEIALCYGIEERLVKNILFMYKYRGREGVVSTTLSAKVIDEIIKLGEFKYI